MKSHKTPTLIISQRIEDYNREYEKKNNNAKKENVLTELILCDCYLRFKPVSMRSIVNTYVCMHARIYTHTHRYAT